VAESAVIFELALLCDAFDADCVVVVKNALLLVWKTDADAEVRRNILATEDAMASADI